MYANQRNGTLVCDMDYIAPLERQALIFRNPRSAIFSSHFRDGRFIFRTESIAVVSAGIAIRNTFGRGRREHAFPFRDRRRSDSIAEHVGRRASHDEKMIDAHDQ